MILSNGKHLVVLELAGLEYPFLEYTCMVAADQAQCNLT
jgi:hypothetical protein